jgi:23S rRNA (adenine2503-C2)-methyltransferase
MTVSTVGVPDTILRLAETGVQLNLAVSLHAGNDALRQRLIPYKNLLGIDQLIDEVEDYYVMTGREATFEYVLLAGVNDRPEDAAEVVKKLRAVHATVNLIPFNKAEGLDFQTPPPKAVGAFRDLLEHKGIRVTIRRRHGSGVHGACGQLRLDAMKKVDG